MNQIAPSEATTTSFGELSRLPWKTVDDHRDRPIILGARHATGAVLAGDQPTRAVARVAVGVAGWMTEDRNGARRLVHLQNSIVRDVAPQEAAGVSEPHRPLAPARARSQLLDASIEQPIFGEPLIEYVNGRIGVDC